MQEPNGLLESPDYPKSSPPPEGEHCEWRITATHGERIVLNITDLDIYESDSCETDFLEIRDGYWPKSPLLGKSCFILDLIIGNAVFIQTKFQNIPYFTLHQN
jgi:tolkin protein